MGKRNQHLAKIERLANLAYKEGKYTTALNLYTTAIDACLHLRWLSHGR
jgi:hypothetical protein